MRKELDLDLEERVALDIGVDVAHARMLEAHLAHIKEEVRASDVSLSAPPGAAMTRKEWDIDGVAVAIGIARHA